MDNSGKSDLLRLLIGGTDLGLISLSYYVAYWLRFGTLAGMQEYIWFLYIAAPMILVSLLRAGALDAARYFSRKDVLKPALHAMLVAGTLAAATLFLSHAGYFSRIHVGLFFVLSTFAVLLIRLLVVQLYRVTAVTRLLSIHLAIIGAGPKFEAIAKEIQSHVEWGLDPVLVLDVNICSAKEIAAKIRSSVVDEVYLIYPRTVFLHEHLDEMVAELENIGIPVRILPNFDANQTYYSQQVDDILGNAAISLIPYDLNPDRRIIKRTIDILFGFLGLVVTAILFPVIAFLIKMDTAGPILFSQIRVGKNGREFRLYKFRSMCEGAEQEQSSMIEKNIYTGPFFKLAKDPRVTRVGRFLRKYSLDEFPQFWNVVKGEMSLVGTRPPTRDEVAVYEGSHRRRISIKPGLTGLWQIGGRSTILDFDEVVRLDTEYIKCWSLWLDLKIVMRTVWVVLFPGRNAGV